MKDEVWKDIDGYIGMYQVSNMGRVRSVDRYLPFNGTISFRKGKFLKPSTDKDGYKFVRLSKHGKSKLFLVHRLVAFSFIPNPNNYPIINHKDEVKDNNFVENLEFCTHEYNMSYGTIKEKISESQRNNPSKSKPVMQYTKDGEFVKEYPSAMEAYRQSSINRGHIAECCRGERRSTGGYVWRYKK